MPTSSAITRRDFLSAINVAAVAACAAPVMARELTTCDAERPAGTRKTLVFADVEYGFCWVPAGERGCWMLETAVDQRLWSAVTGYNPSGFRGANLPVEQVSYNDCQAFLAKLNAASETPENCSFRLPTESEWETACLAGADSHYWWGDALNGDRANCDGNYPAGTAKKGPFVNRTTPVKAYGANPWGLYGMNGNVWEWCAANDGESRLVFRGGAWTCEADACRAESRRLGAPTDRNSCLGFRFVLAGNC